MKISKVDVLKVKVPLKYRIVGWQSVLPSQYMKEVPNYSLHTIVRITLDDGSQGLGESASNTPDYDELLINNYIAPRLKGEGAFNIEKIVEKMETVVASGASIFVGGWTGYPAIAAVETALYDVVAKALSTPIYNMIGGKYRETIPITWVIGIKSIKDSVNETINATRAGFKEVKIKSDVNDYENAARVKAIREAIGDKVRIRVDANGQWKPKQAVRIIKSMERFGLDCVEQPVRGITGLAEVARCVDTPVMADESLQTASDAFRLLHENAAQVFNVYIMKSGFVGSKKILGIAAAQGIPAMLGSNLELGIGTSASAHLAVSSAGISLPCDLIGTMHHSDDVTSPKLEVSNGELMAPEGAGLGLRLDLKKLRKYTMP